VKQKNSLCGRFSLKNVIIRVMASKSSSNKSKNPTVETVLLEQLKTVSDYRRGKSVNYPLHEILFIALCAVMSGAEAFTEFEEFGLVRKEWLKRFLRLKHGIPSHDTFRQVFSLIDPKQFNEVFIRWTQSICKVEGTEIIAIDGKTLKGSAKDKAVHIVNAWATGNKLVLGQLKTEDKSNEITAVPQLLKQLKIKGAVITLDAMGTQKDIAQIIHESKADYVLPLKKNHRKLYKSVKLQLDDPENLKKLPSFEQTNTGHGRNEIRRHWICSDVKGIDNDAQWSGLKTIGKVERVREIKSGKSKGKLSVETFYYISSIEPDAEFFAECIRSHWGVENKLHWILDVTFREDDCQVREKTAATNLSMLRKVAMNLFRLHPSKGSMRLKRKKAGWEIEFLEQVVCSTHA